MSSLLTPPDSTARSRRANRSSSSESSRGVFGVSAVKYRVGAPPLPPLPYRYRNLGYTSVRYLSQFEAQFAGYAESVLASHRITQYASPFGMDDDPGFGCEVHPKLIERSLPGTGESEVVLSITANWEQDSLISWESAVKAIKTYIDQVLDDADLETVDIGVEIMAPEVIARRYMTLAEYHAGLDREWPLIKTWITNGLQSFGSTRDHMTSISLFRLGLNPDVKKNPVTVYITVDYSVPENSWPPVVSLIQGYLDGLSYPLVLRLEHGVMDLYSFEHLPSTHDNSDPIRRLSRNFPERPQIGSDISPAKYLCDDKGKTVNSGMGTLGCYLEIKTQSTPHWTPYALTNYHIVRPCMDGFMLAPGKKAGKPVENSEVYHADRNGFTPKKISNMAPMEYPSRGSLNYTLTDLNRRIDRLSESSKAQVSQFTNQKKRIEMYMNTDMHIFGTLFCGSGLIHRSVGEARLDWALVKVYEDHLGSNKLPPADDWDMDYYSQSTELAVNNPTRLQDFCADRSLKNIGHASPVFKIGAATGKTAGYFSTYMSDVCMFSEAVGKINSTEIVIICSHDDRDMAQPGESGSVVFNDHGEIIGLVFGGPIRENGEHRYMFVTPIEDVYEHIKRVSKGKITDIRVMQA